MASGECLELPVPLVMEPNTFNMRHEKTVVDMEKRMHDDIQKKKKRWEKDVDKMKMEFLSLTPADKEWGSDELLNDPLVSKRRGSTDILDPKKMRTMFLDYPDVGRRFKIRFNVAQYEKESIRVSADAERIVVKGVKIEREEGHASECEYNRKIKIPREVDSSKLKCTLTQDGILIVEAPLHPQSPNLRKLSHSTSYSSQSSFHSQPSSRASSRSRSPSNSPQHSANVPKFGIPLFTGKDGDKVLSLMAEVGVTFKAKDITLLVLKDNHIQIKAKNERRTSDRLSKNKFFKEYELPEKIEPTSVRAGVSIMGLLSVIALNKGNTMLKQKDVLDEYLEKQMNDKVSVELYMCNVLNVASFPPTHVVLASEMPDSNSETDE